MVKRFFVTKTADMEEDTEGDWVLFYDYLALQSKLEDREKRLTFAADALAVVERRRDELLSRLDKLQGELRGASEEIEYQAKLRKEVERRLHGSSKLLLDIRSDLLLRGNVDPRDDGVAIVNLSSTLWNRLSDFVSGTAPAGFGRNAEAAQSSVVEKHERNCCEWHKAGGDLEYPCNRL